MADECLMDCVGYHDNNDLFTVKIRQPDGRPTYDSLGAATIILTVLQKIIEDLGARYCVAGS